MLCGCGEELHYNDPFAKDLVQSQVDRLGECILVEVTGQNMGVWVPRHYIALHGLKAADLPALAKRYGWATDA